MLRYCRECAAERGISKQNHDHDDRQIVCDGCGKRTYTSFSQGGK